MPEPRIARPGEAATSLLAIAVERGGIRKGARAGSVVVSWAIAERDLGRPLGDDESLSAAVRDYAAYWKQSERTAWRELERFREVFGEESPARLARLIGDVADVRQHDKLLTAPLLAA